ncbi:MAG: septum formation protein Maf [Candidatus Binataceae bacterium]|nr:septum formation protein Maf [Candidatus Binataceae bacterium]
MDSDAPKLVLASGSPRRRSLLDAAGLSFSIVESRLHERRRPGEPGEQFALRMARDKATAVSRRIVSPIVLGADTIVELDGNVLGKPKDAAEAHSMLRMLSGRTHTVITAFAIAHGGEILESAAMASRVTFHELREDQIAAYIASGDPFDKAGSYGIQDGGAEFIAAVEGTRDNVMGLPVREVIAVLARHGIEPV